MQISKIKKLPKSAIKSAYFSIQTLIEQNRACRYEVMFSRLSKWI